MNKFPKINEGIALLQGPPGTGKTTTTAHLLWSLYNRNQKTLVCAPSNKAVQVLLERFTALHLNTQVILIGSQEKVKNSALEIFSLDCIKAQLSAIVSEVDEWCDKMKPAEVIKLNKNQKKQYLTSQYECYKCLVNRFNAATVHVNNFDTPIYKSFRTRFSSFVQAMNTYYEKAITANANVWNKVKQKLQSVSYIPSSPRSGDQKRMKHL